MFIEIKGYQHENLSLNLSRTLFFKENSQHFSGFIKKGWGAHPKNKTTCRAKKNKKETSPNQENPNQWMGVGLRVGVGSVVYLYIYLQWQLQQLHIDHCNQKLHSSRQVILSV